MKSEQFNKELWERVDTLCKKRKISLKALAEKCNITHVTIYHQIGQNNCPPLYQAMQMAEVLEVSLDYLATGEDKFINSKFTAMQNKLNEIYEIASSKN